MKIMAILLSVLITVSISCGKSAERTAETHPAKVGGCSLDTLTAGYVRSSRPAGTAADRLTVKAVRDTDVNLLEGCAEELVALLDSLGIEVYGRSGVIHVTNGPCWPAWSVTVLTARAQGRLLPALSSTNIAGFTPSKERPADYGAFFITAGRGSSDLWTVWYKSGQR